MASPNSSFFLLTKKHLTLLIGIPQALLNLCLRRILKYFTLKSKIYPVSKRGFVWKHSCKFKQSYHCYFSYTTVCYSSVTVSAEPQERRINLHPHFYRYKTTNTRPLAFFFFFPEFFSAVSIYNRFAQTFKETKHKDRIMVITALESSKQNTFWALRAGTCS